MYLYYKRQEWRCKFLHRESENAASRRRCRSTKVCLCIGAKNFVILVRESESLVMFQIKFCIYDKNSIGFDR